jgi:lysozyme family protein
VSNAEAGGSDFERALKATLAYEGGFSDVPQDPGGATMMGVTASTFWHYLSDHGQPLRSVRTITGAELRDIYQARYWEPVTQGRTWPLNAVLFDVGVNSGVGTALWMLEQAKLTVPVTDPNRMKALALAVCDVRERFFKGIVQRRPLSAVFLRGWLRRVNEQRALCQT